ncbi:mannitol-1-phosphate 5-dehydrogenase, partial [Salmonella enterica subsp. enterica serovar Enteritidis]
HIERKLFTVNTGHATTAYVGKANGHNTIVEALNDPEVLNEVRAVLNETGALIVEKWGLSASEHQEYIGKIIERFQNPHISNDITRVGRGPIRKLGYEERFIQPLREANERGLPTKALIRTIG